MHIRDAPLIAVCVISVASLAGFGVAAFGQQPARPAQGTAPPSPQTGAPSPTGPPAQGTPAAPAPVDRVFGSEAGMIFNPIKSDKAADFEMVLGRIREALSQSKDPVRRKQAASWKVFKAVEPGANGSATYVFVMDPAVPGADYTVSKILAEAFPAEVRELYKTYIGAFQPGVSPSLMNLKLLVDFSESATDKPASERPATLSQSPASRPVAK
jgi:hypothetical protein